MVDDTPGWTLLPDVGGARMHLTAPDRPGWARCGRQLDPHAAVHRRNPGFDACTGCADAAGYPTVLEDAHPSVPVPASVQPLKRPRRLTRPQPTSGPGTWRVPAGWVRLEGPRVAHHPHPEQPGRAMCGRVVDDAVPVHRQRPVTVPPCPQCRSARITALQAERAATRPAAPAPQPAATARAVPRPREPLSTPVGSAPTYGWILVTDADNRLWAHRPDPQRADRTLCKATALEETVRSRPKTSMPCPECQRAWHKLRQDAGLRTIRVAPRSRAARARSGGSSIRTVSGGLPTLGHRR